MSYLSLTFAGFVILSLVLYYTVPAKLRWGVLLAASLFFYGCFDLRYLVFLLSAAATTYACARLVEKTKRKKWLVGGCIALNAGVWFVIKELPWLFTTAVRVLDRSGLHWDAPTLSLLVPVGLSYFTLQAIAYLIDVAKGKVEAQRNFFQYLLFLSWFPAIVQGPISRYDQLMPRLLHTNKFSYEGMRHAALLVLFGLVKKMVIADRLGILANHCFGNYEDLSGIVLYLGVVAYSIQLYADFSGCVDLGRGVSGLFGVDMVQNFDRPYQSRSVKEFWSRWHMSLSGWLKDYIYIPLGGNRKGTFRKYLNITVTFLVSGLWHGAGFNFFLWGLMHAAYQIIGELTLPFRKNVKQLIGMKEGSASERICQTVITFHLVALAWIVFRAGGLATGIDYIRNMLTTFNPWVLVDSTLFRLGLSQNHLVFLVAHIVLLLHIQHRFPRQEDTLRGVLDAHLVLRWIIYLVLIFDVLLFGVYGKGYDMGSFMYGGF